MVFGAVDTPCREESDLLLKQELAFFQFDEVNKMFYLHPEVVERQSPLLVEHVEDILRYRQRLMIRLYKEDIE